MALTRQEIETAKAETMLKQSLSMPHRTYPPAMTHDGMCWVATAKFIDDSMLVGRGLSPAEALMDYDLQWLGVKGKE